MRTDVEKTNVRNPYIMQKQKIQTLEDLELILLPFFRNSLAMNLLIDINFQSLPIQPPNL